jgi:ElaB/YqjD/DUF883 family membrane-anchored ribosome-binding protein
MPEPIEHLRQVTDALADHLDTQPNLDTPEATNQVQTVRRNLNSLSTSTNQTLRAQAMDRLVRLRGKVDAKIDTMEKATGVKPAIYTQLVELRHDMNTSGVFRDVTPGIAAVTPFPEDGRHVEHALIQKPYELTHQAGTLISRNPLLSAGIFTGIGVLASRLFMPVARTGRRVVSKTSGFIWSLAKAVGLGIVANWTFNHGRDLLNGNFTKVYNETFGSGVSPEEQAKREAARKAEEEVKRKTEEEAKKTAEATRVGGTLALERLTTPLELIDAKNLSLNNEQFELKRVGPEVLLAYKGSNYRLVSADAPPKPVRNHSETLTSVRVTGANQIRLGATMAGINGSATSDLGELQKMLTNAQSGAVFEMKAMAEMTGLERIAGSIQLPELATAVNRGGNNWEVTGRVKLVKVA